MRIVFLGNNLAGLRALQWLKSTGENLVALVVHPPENQKYGDELAAAAGLDPANVFLAPQLASAETREAIARLRPDIALSVFFGYILKREFLNLFPRGCLNLHPAFLPFNRGAYPNVWSILEGTPAGATLHLVDDGVDTGDIVAQRALKVEAEDTGQTLYHKLEEHSIGLLKESWPLIKAGTLRRSPQPNLGGTTHRARDVERVDQIHLDARYTARELINLMRARTFPPHPSAYFIEDGRKVFLELKLTRENSPQRPADV